MSVTKNMQLNYWETGRQDGDLKLDSPNREIVSKSETMQTHYALMLWFPKEMTAGTNQYLPDKHCCYFCSHGSDLRSRRKLQILICEEWKLCLEDDSIQAARYLEH